jgi:hypothetical protein
MLSGAIRATAGSGAGALATMTKFAYCKKIAIWNVAGGDNSPRRVKPSGPTAQDCLRAERPFADTRRFAVVFDHP